MGLAVTGHPTWDPYWFVIWAPHGSIMGSPYGLVRMRKPVYMPHWAHMGLLSGPNMGSLWVFPYGHERMGSI